MLPNTAKLKVTFLRSILFPAELKVTGTDCVQGEDEVKVMFVGNEVLRTFGVQLIWTMRSTVGLGRV